MAKAIELRRHTDNDDDVLTDEGVRAALELGGRLDGDYELLVSTGAQRATQTAACLLAGLDQKVPGGVIVDTGLRSDVEDRWKQAYQDAGGGELADFRSVDPELVEQDSQRLGEALRRVLERLGEDGRALVVGHSPSNEAAVLGLTGQEIGPLSKGEGVLIVEESDGQLRVEPLG
ncbi:MAG: histidine phosphatase family protein [Egibacteraceae bacterium]